MQQLVTALVTYLGAALSKTEGAKTYTAAAGLLGLAVYQCTQSDYDKGVANLFMALACIGLRAAQAKTDGKVDETVREGDKPAA